MANRQSKGLLGGWYCDEVDVICHQTPSEQADALAIQMTTQDLDVALPVRSGIEHVLTIIAALGDVVRNSRSNKPGTAGHTG